MITEPIALDKSLNTTDQNPKNLADVVQKGLNDIKNAIGGGGGGGGHTIVDSDGQDMPQEDAMQFADAFVSDDSTNGRTVVENVKEVTLAELEQATERGMYLATDEESVPIGASSEDKIEVTGDGVKTLGQLLNAIYNDTKFDITKITKDTKLVFGTNVYFPTIISPDYNYVRFTRETCNASYLYIEDYTISSSSVAYATTVNGNTYSRVDDSSTVEPNGLKLTLYYGTSSTVINLKTSADYCQYDENTTVKQKIDKTKTETISVTFTSGKSGNILDGNKILLSAELLGSSILFGANVSSGQKIGYGLVALNSAIQVDTGVSGSKSVTVTYIES